MEKHNSNSHQNFDGTKSEILKKRLLKSVNTPLTNISLPSSQQNNALLNPLRAPIPNSMIVSSIQPTPNTVSIAHNFGQSLTPVKIHPNNHSYPLHLSTVHVPVQIPGSTSNINVPVQLSVPTSTVPLQLAPVSLPLQVSGTTNVPVQLSAGETINVPLQIPNSQSIQLTGQTLPSMPLLHTTNQPLHSSIIHLHMGSNGRATNLDRLSDLSISNSSQLHMTDSSGVQIKMNSSTPVSQVQVGNSQAVVQISSSSNNSLQMRNTARPVPHVVYIQTPSGLKPVSSTEVISQASTSGNPPQIIVRRPVTSTANLQLLSNVSTRPHIAPKLATQNKSSILAPVNASQPIVIQKPKANDKVMVPVSIAPGIPPKQAIAYLGQVKKPITKNLQENQSILISNNQPNNANNKLFLTPMNMPIIQNKQNAKFILPVTLPTTMASKGPIINLQIANGQIQNDPQGNITVMRDTGVDPMDMPPLHPLGKIMSLNGKDNFQNKGDNSYTSITIPGSRAEPTGEQGEYTLSIPETNSALNDDIYTVSIEDDEGQTREESFTLAISDKSNNSLLNKNMSERNDAVIAAPAILRRSNSDNSETDRKSQNANAKRRVSLCTDNLSKNKSTLLSQNQRAVDYEQVIDNSDDHRVPSLFCDEKLDKDLESKAVGDSDADEYKDKRKSDMDKGNDVFYSKSEGFNEPSKLKAESDTSEEDPPGLIWNNGVAVLQGSGLQFQTNEFGLIDLIDSAAHDLININAKYQTPLKQRIDRKNKKVTSPEDLYRCEGCGCHGMAAEFITPNFCSSTCQLEVEKTLAKKREREKADLLKKRNKMKKLLMRKQLSDSDITSESKEQEKVSLKSYDQSIPVEITEPLKADEVENEKYPWMCGKNGFSWMRYLDVCKAKAAPVKMFKNPFPYGRNGFRVGMRMEAIDPQHPSLFCVVTVAEVQGYRMRLHFDEYSDVYDYWVNADCADIFPPGWCEKNNRTLQPPASFTTATFSWPTYLKQVRAVAAPRQLFAHVTTTVLKPNCFRIGMKLEAEDRKNEMICAATVADMLDNRLRINFDSWDEMYDYWVEPNSPYIHPIGWAEENGLTLTPPNFYKESDTFSWENYLSETNATAAPPRAFKTRLPQGFKTAMKLEVVDRRVPFLIRVASISEVKGHQVRVSFDGWGPDLSHWLDDDSPDLHPVGWCLKTGHPLEPPLTREELLIPGACGVGGCRGLGSVRGGAVKQHSAPAACPYRAPPPPRPERVTTPHEPDRTGPRERRYVQHSAPAACPYRAPPPPRPERVTTPHEPDRTGPRERRYVQHSAPAACPYRAPPPPRPERVTTPHEPDRTGPRERRYVQHSAPAACPYRAPPPPRPERVTTPHEPDRTGPRERRYVQHSAPAACPYRAPPPPRPERVTTPHEPDRTGPRERRYVQHSAPAACPYRAPPPPRPERVTTPHEPDRTGPRERRYVQHSAPAACPYRAPPPPRPERVTTPHEPDRTGPRERRYVQHSAPAACPYRAPPPPRPERVTTPHEPDRTGPRERRYVQHSAPAACPYRAPPPPRPERVTTPHEPDRTGPRERRYVQHSAPAACPYRAPPPPRPERVTTPHEPDRTGPRERRYVQHSAPAACPYRAPPPPRPERVTTPHEPDRTGPRERRSRGRPPKHKRLEEVTKNDASDEESVSSSGGKRWRGPSAPRLPSPRLPSPRPAAPRLPPLRANVAQHIAELGLPSDPTSWSQDDVVALVTRVAGPEAGAAVCSARLGGAELVMCSREELVCVARLRLGPAVKLYSCVRQLRARPA